MNQYLFLLGFFPLLVLVLSFFHAFYLLFFPGFQHKAITVMRVAVAISVVAWMLVVAYWVLFGRTVNVKDGLFGSVNLATVATTAFVVLIPIHGLTVSLVKNWSNKALKIGLCVFHGAATLIAVLGIAGLLFISLVGNMELCSKVSSGPSDKCGSLQF